MTTQVQIPRPAVVGATVNSPCTMLRVKGTQIVDAADKPIILKGAGLGGHLNMENFISGYPGHEHQHREAMAAVLGAEKAQFFFDKFLEYFFTNSDAQFFASLGLNCIRVPFNYRHFIDDANPHVLKPSGFQLLDRIINICASHNLYVILDLHAVPGGQNQDWHSDSGIAHALFWDHRVFQDMVVNLWVQIATHYKGNPVIAGYNPLNEPADPKHTRLIDWYARVEQAIRAVDPDHILYIDGNTYAMDFSHFPTTPLPNSVYSCHDYSMMGFPGQEQFDGSGAHKERLRKSFERKVTFMKDRGVPIWNGEFGPVYSDPRLFGTQKAISDNQTRYALLKAQLAIYAQSSQDVSWSIWLYKDIGYQGMVYLDPESPYMKLISDFVAKKQTLGLDFWGSVDKSAVDGIYKPFIQGLKSTLPEHLHNKKYPHIWTFERHVERVVRECLMSEYHGHEFAELFRGKSMEELDVLAASFKLENCLKRDELNNILMSDSQ